MEPTAHLTGLMLCQWIDSLRFFRLITESRSPFEEAAAMHRIEPLPLWIGHAGDGRDPKAMGEVGLAAVVQLAMEEPIPILPRDVLLFRVPILDGDGNDPVRLCLAIDLVSQLLQQRLATLVCCSAGASRSPAVAAVAMARIIGRTPVDCLKVTRDQHPTDVSPGLWNELLKYTSLSGRFQ